MELKHGPKPKQSTVQLENDTEAKLFITEGLGLISIKGLKLAFDVMKAQADNEWPVKVIVGNKRLEHASHRMSDEAARLSAYQTQTGLGLANIGDYPDGAENELALRTMVADINEHLDPAVAA